MKKETTLREGMLFGYLTVLERVDNGKCRGYKWKCVCACGEIRNIREYLLIKGLIRSCGCKRHDGTKRKLPPGEAAFNHLYKFFEIRTPKRNLVWALDKQTVRKLTSSNCHYCGAPPSHIKKAAGGNYVYNGIDRVNNKLGYIPGNVVTCCGVCNKMKEKLGYGEFLKLIEIIYNHRVKHVVVRLPDFYLWDKKHCSICGQDYLICSPEWERHVCRIILIKDQPVKNKQVETYPYICLELALTKKRKVVDFAVN